MSAFPERLELGTSSPLTLEPDVLFVRMSETTAPARRRLQTTLSDLRLDRAGTRPEAAADRPDGVLNEPPNRSWLRTTDARSVERAEVAAVQVADDVEWVAPVYRVGTTPGPAGLVAPLPTGLLVRPVPGQDRPAVEAALAAEGLEYSAQLSKHLTGFLYFTYRDPADRSIYQTAPTIPGRYPGVVATVRFEMMPMLSPLTAEPDDMLYPQQWNMTQIRAGGPGTTGWTFTTGRADVLICIIDSGVDLEHPDLRIQGDGINLGTMSGTGAPAGARADRGHGTACAGVAAAVFGNALGVAGLAGACRVLPAAFSDGSDMEVANGIGWAIDNGADVISMSFGWSASFDFDVIDAAIARAVEAGVVMCAATGNDDSSVANYYPARHPDVIAVGASDEVDNRKSASSPDGEWWWGSNFGPGVSVTAPGVLIPATDLRGARGTDDEGLNPDGDYFLSFNGTSAATPHVAGLAALIRSLAPRLNAVEIRDTIERTAAKVGTIPYANEDGFPNGTRNDEMGYGRIDVFAALSDVWEFDLNFDVFYVRAGVLELLLLQ
ncbi:S8 family serine peptidase [Nocardia sp. GCM10030253]|uniref:S8 family serine peptidase n=1 Tax=Nocardia sp. GCM10030253 TaxID=3273404 RepID=UPI00362E16D0